MSDTELDHNMEFEKISDREDINYAIGWLLDEIGYVKQQLTQKDAIIKCLTEAVEVYGNNFNYSVNGKIDIMDGGKRARAALLATSEMSNE